MAVFRALHLVIRVALENSLVALYNSRIVLDEAPDPWLRFAFGYQ